MQLINRKLNADIYDTGNKDAKKRIIKRTVITNGLNSPDLITGEMLPTDKTAKAEINGTSTHAATRCRGKFYIGDKVGAVTKHLCEVRYPNGDGIGVKIQGNNSLSAVNGNKAAFLDDSGTYEIDSEILHHGVRNTIVISDPVNAPNEYTLTLKDKGNSSYTYEIANGGIVATDLNGGKPIFFGAPWVVDANGEYGSVQYTLGDKVGNIQTVYKTIDLAWLRSRTGIVKCDPSVTIQDGVDGGIIYDSRLYAPSPDNNYGASIYLGTNNASGGALESGVFFVDLSAYPGVIVTSATIRAYCQIRETNNNYDVDIHPILRTWGEGNKNGTAASAGEVTFNSSEHSVQTWTSAGCRGAGTDRGTDLIGTYNPSTDIVAGQYNDITLNAALFQSNIIDGTNNGLVLGTRTIGSVTSSSVLFYSSEGASPVQFIMEYTDGDEILFFFNADY